MKTRVGEFMGTPSPRRDRRRITRPVLWGGAVGLAVAALTLAAGWLLPAEYRVGAEVVIPRPAERVWQGFVQPDRWGDWLQGIRSITVTSDLREGVGSRRRIISVLPDHRELISEVEVTEWEDGVRYAHRHLKDSLNGWTLPVSDGRVEIDLERVADQASRLRVNASFRANGPLARWWAFVVAKPLADAFLSDRLDELHARLQADGQEMNGR